MMVRDKGQTVDPRIRRTERAVMAAAGELFVRQGYTATTMSQIASAADCAERTLFLRFTSKAELLKRVVDQTFAGMGSEEPVPDEPGTDEPGTDKPGPTTPGSANATPDTLEARLQALANNIAATMIRTGPLFAVAREAEASEPLIREAFDAARRDTIAASRRMWSGLERDGLISSGIDVDWVADTTALLGAADTYLLIRTAMGWDQQQLAAWLSRTWLYFATNPEPAAVVHP